MTALTRSDTELSPIPPADPLVFVDRANVRGAAPEEIQKYIDLYERVTTIRAKIAYTESMRRSQIQMPTILKDAPGQNSKYPKFENLLMDIKPIYTANGFAMSFSTEDSKLADHYRVVCNVQHVGGHSERFVCDFPTDGRGAKGGASSMNAVQAVGSTMSYARRYLTMMIFNLTIAGEDTDAGRHQVATEAELEKQKSLLEKVREAFDAADLTSEQDAIFWEWAEVTCLADLDPRKYPDAIASLKRKARENAAAQKAVTA